jgi:uncharacterized protein (TIGR03437 family)
VPTAIRWLAAALFFLPVLAGADRIAALPSYSAKSIVNAASGELGYLAPNTIASIYGTNLSWTTAAVAASDLQDGLLPTVLPGTGVKVIVGNIPAHLFYVSPTLINFLVPSILRPGPVKIYVEVDAHTSADDVTLNLDDTGPSLFLQPDSTPSAVRLDASLITPGKPITPGEVAVLFATGLGTTTPPADYGRAATVASWITALDDSDILIDGARLERDNILYIGLAPTFAGLYQINIRIPDWAAPNPEIRIRIGKKTSPEGVHLPLQPK